MAQLNIFALVFFAFFMNYPLAAATCEMPSTKAVPSAEGEASIAGLSGPSHALHWIKLAAPKQPAQGTLFYLAGGPLSHMLYTDLAAGFQKRAFPQFDVVLYDYYGFNCSSALQSVSDQSSYPQDFTMEGMASDFIRLKRKLLPGKTKVYLMGGSHGAMLGSMIVSRYPNEIEKAILFSGDTESGWLSEGYFRLDRLMAKLDISHPGFGLRLKRLLEAAENGGFEVKVGGRELLVDRPTLEFGIWLNFALDSNAQAALPMLIGMAQSGQTDWIGGIALSVEDLLALPAKETSPTESSVVTNFHRCNVWFPKSWRDNFSHPDGAYFKTSSLLKYWNKLCANYDKLGNYPFNSIPNTPTTVPILSWVGDQDTFDPHEAHKRWAQLTTKLTFHVKSGWSHDFGTDVSSGTQQAVEMVKAFLTSTDRKVAL